MPYRHASSLFLEVLKLYTLSPQLKSSFLMPCQCQMFNGTRQGCSLSPLLFLLCLEPLATEIWLQPDVRAVKIRQKEFKLSLFADDILLTVTEPHTSLLHKILHIFSELSSYKSNTSKTGAFPLNISSPQLTLLQQNYTYHWCSNSIKYLDTHITPTYSSLYEDNLSSLFKKICYLLH